MSALRSFTSVVLCVVAFVTCQGQSASALVDEVGPMLKDASTLAQARARVETVLKADPNNVDALMLMGNVIYREFELADHPGSPDGMIELRGADNESIYDPTMASMGSAMTVPPAAVARDVVAPWLKAVTIDPSRTDIHMGICHVYSISALTDELIGHLTVLKDHMEVDDNTPYKLADYAHNLNKRGHFADCMRVYERLTELFPKNSGLMSDVAGTWFQGGDPVKAREWADKAMAQSGHDEMSCASVFFIYAVLELNDHALKTLKEECRLNDTHEDLLYQGILELLAGKDARSTFHAYVNGVGTSEDGLALAKILAERDLDSISTYHEVTEVHLNDGFLLPLHRFFRVRIGGFEPSFNYAEALGYNHRDADAVRALDAISTEGLITEQLEKIRFHRAWSLMRSDNKVQAFAEWEHLLGSNNGLYRSAAAWFLGSSCKEREPQRAKAYFQKASTAASENKYAMMCANALAAMER